MKKIHQYRADNTDMDILNILLHNSKTTNREIASRLKIAVGTVNTRIKKLEKEKVIRRYSIFINYEKLRYHIEVIIRLKIKEGRFLELSKKFISDPGVFEMFDTTGDYDAEILARFHNKRELDLFVKRLQQDDLVIASSTSLMLNIIRENQVS